MNAISISTDPAVQLAFERSTRQQIIQAATLKIIEEQRSRFGRELHDNINQMLSCANLYFDMLAPSTPGEQEIKQKGLNIIAEAVQEIRDLSRTLVKPQVTGRNLVSKMKALMHDYKMTSGLKIVFTQALHGRMISAAKAITLYRILQEQLKNITTHSNADMVTISLVTDTKKIQLKIADNGTVNAGNREKKKSSGVGLRNIRERVALHNGRMVIIAKPGYGYKLTATLPRLLKLQKMHTA